MKFTYNEVEYDLVDPEQWTTLEAMQVQKFTGRQPLELWNELVNAGPMGVHAAVWLSLRRSGVDVAWGELTIPHFGVVKALNRDVLEEPPDPSSASTQQRSASTARRPSSARSRKS